MVGKIYTDRKGRRYKKVMSLECSDCGKKKYFISCSEFLKEINSDCNARMSQEHWCKFVLIKEETW